MNLCVQLRVTVTPCSNKKTTLTRIVLSSLITRDSKRQIEIVYKPSSPPITHSAASQKARRLESRLHECLIRALLV